MTARDYQRVLDIVARIQHADSLEQFVDTLLAELLRLLDGEIAGWNEIDLTTGSLTGRGLPEDVAGPLYPIVAAHLAEHPLIRHFAEASDVRSLRISDVVTSEEWAANPLYQEAFKPFGLDYQIAVPLLTTERTLSTVAVSRGGRDFTDRDKALLDTLAPLAADVERDRRWQESLESTVAEVAGGPLQLVASDGTVLASTPPPDVVRAYADAAELDRPPRFRLVPASADAPPPLPLTPKQLAALLAVADGATVTAAARQLGVSPRTLNKHLQTAYARLRVSGRIAALVQLRKAGLLRD